MRIELQLEPATGLTVDEANALEALLPGWLAATREHLPTAVEHCSVCLRVVDASESQFLNQSYRGIDKPTNVLSFPAELPAQLASNAMAAEASELDELPFGDLALCWPVVEAEAAAQGKRVLDHCAHLVVHGLLHLAGYDHEDDTEAAAMEALEVAVLAKLSIADPYLEEVS